MSLKKQYLKKSDSCKVTFSLTKETVGSADSVCLVGDFNDWSQSANPMKKLKNGTFTASLHLQKDEEYQFRYLLDGRQWENEWQADKYLPNQHGSDNSVVIV